MYINFLAIVYLFPLDPCILIEFRITKLIKLKLIKDTFMKFNNLIFQENFDRKQVILGDFLQKAWRALKTTPSLVLK